MQQTTTKPVILFIPGSFCPAKLYDDVVKNLQEAGYEAVAYDLPSASRKAPQKAASLADDAEFFNHKAALLADQGKQIALLGHSYGGMVASECVKGLSKSEREAVGQRGYVSKIVFLTAVIPAVGESLRDLMGELVPEFIKLDCEFMYHEPTGAAKVNLSDLPYDKAVKLAAQFSHHSTRSFRDELTYAGYNHVPSAYIVCDRDVVLTPDFQRAGIEHVEKSSGRKVKVLHCDSGHCPHLSVAQDLAALVQEAVED